MAIRHIRIQVLIFKHSFQYAVKIFDLTQMPLIYLLKQYVVHIIII